MKRVEREFVLEVRLVVLIVAVIFFACCAAMFGCGCRTYYVYQFGDKPSINVDAKVDKEITPTLKASVQ